MGADVGRAATGLAYLQDIQLPTVRVGTPCDEMMRETILHSRGFGGSYALITRFVLPLL